MQKTPALSPARAVSTAAMADLFEASMAPATRRAYQGALTRLEVWLDGAALDDAALATYLGALDQAEKSPAVAGQVVAAVRFRARLNGWPVPVGPLAERALAGFRRKGADRGRGPVAGVRWDQADCAAALAARDGRALAGLRDAAILAIASDALLRTSEIAALDVSDLDAAENTVTVKRSKTDQDGVGAALFIGPPTIERLAAWIDAAGLADEGPLFRRITKGGGRVLGRLSARSVRRIITARAAATGIPGRISGHSLRIGAAQSLAAAGASVVEMQQAGRWQSPSMPGRYARGPLARRGAVARLRYGA